MNADRNTPNGTEVKIVNTREYLDEPILLVGADPTEPDGFAVVVDGEGLLEFVAWEHLRLVELVKKEGSEEENG